MKIQQRVFTHKTGWAADGEKTSGGGEKLVLAFGAPALLIDPKIMAEAQALFPGATIFGCSTAGEIRGTQVLDDSLVLTATAFSDTQFRAAEVLLDGDDSAAGGAALGRALKGDDLAHVLVLSAGLNVNGSALVKGLTSELPAEVAVTGGLSGDGARFQETWVYSGGKALANCAAGIGFYGNKLKVGYGSMGGWGTFGPERRVTHSRGNVLYELDGEPALELYKRYLGTHAAGLPASGLRFPLSMRCSTEDKAVVRTLLAVNERENSVTFAGDIPQESCVRLMHANIDRLVDGATGAAKVSREGLGSSAAELAILISCVGRKLILGQRAEEEVEAVGAALGGASALTGFYSYGEIAPFARRAKCELHNQTMTVTVFAEVA